MKIGIGLAGGIKPSRVVALARAMEGAELDSLWVTEGAGGDAFGLLAATALATQKLLLGTAVVSVHTRSLPLIAMGAATVNDLSEGRFRLGLGAGHREQVVGEHGATFERPLSRLEDAIDVVHELHRSGKVDHAELRTTSIEFFQLNFPHPTRPRIYVAVGGPRAAELAARKADGILLVWRFPSEVMKLRANGLAGLPTGLLLHCAVGEVEVACHDALRLARDRHARFERYRGLFDLQDSIPGLACHEPEALAVALTEYHAAGVDELVLVPLPTEGATTEEAATALLNMITQLR